MIWDIPEMWADQTVYIIGGGPSILRTPLRLIEERCVIGVNNAFTLGPWVDINFFGDEAWWQRECLNVMRHPGIIVTQLPQKIFSSMKRVKQVKKNKRLYGLYTKTRDSICWNQNSGGASINLAVLLGAARIVLIGFDFKTDKERGFRDGHNWHKFHGVAPPQDIYVNKFLKGFQAIKRDANLLGTEVEWPRKVEILNATPDTALHTFPEVALEDTL